LAGLSLKPFAVLVARAGPRQQFFKFIHSYHRIQLAITMPNQTPNHDYSRDELLIELVKNRKPLCNMASKSYRESKSVKENCWKFISEEMTKSFGPPCTGKKN